MTTEQILTWVFTWAIANPVFGGVPLIIAGLLGTFSMFSTTIFKLLHWGVKLTKTNKDDLMVARVQDAWVKLEAIPLIGKLFKLCERVSLIKR